MSDEKILWRSGSRNSMGFILVILAALLMITPACSPISAPEPTLTPTSNSSEIKIEGIPRTSKEALLRELEVNNSILIVDVRIKAEYAKGHIRGSVSAPLSEITEGKWQPPPNKEIIFY